MTKYLSYPPTLLFDQILFSLFFAKLLNHCCENGLWKTDFKQKVVGYLCIENAGLKGRREYD